MDVGIPQKREHLSFAAPGTEEFHVSQNDNDAVPIEIIVKIHN
jgi:hypothetical protein